MKINTINGNDASETLIHKKHFQTSSESSETHGRKTSYSHGTEENAVSSLITNRWKIPVLVTKKLLKCRRQKGSDREDEFQPETSRNHACRLQRLSFHWRCTKAIFPLPNAILIINIVMIVVTFPYTVVVNAGPERTGDVRCGEDSATINLI